MTGERRRRTASDRSLHRTAWSLAAGSIVVTLVGIILAVVEGLSGGVGLLAPMSIVGIGYAVIGARVVDVRPRNPVGWLLIGTALSWGLSATCYQYAELALSLASGPAVGATLAAWIYTWAWLPGGAALLVFMPLLFPTGHLLTRRWYRFAVLMAILVTFDTVVHAAASLQYLDDLPLLIAYTPQLDPGVMGVLAGLGDFWYFGSLVAVAAVFIRLRRSTGIERQQIRWYGIGIAIAAVAVIVMGVLRLEIAGPLMIVVSVIPVAIGIAMLVTADELDRLVSRTIAYAVVTGLLLATYAGLILVLEGPLGTATGGETLPVALSTLAGRPCSRPSGDESSGSSTGASTGPAMTPRGRRRLLRAAPRQGRPRAVTADLDTRRTAMAPATMLVWLREGRG